MKLLFVRTFDQHEYIMSNIMKRIEDIIRADSFILGPVVEKFEAKFAQMMGVKHAVGVASGTDAILLSLRLLDLQPDDQVIFPVFGRVAIPMAVLRVGAAPIFVDVDPLSGLLDLAKLEGAINQNTRVIIATHLYGKALNMNGLMELARKHNIAVIEDCAQAAGGQFHGRSLGAFGISGCFSFNPQSNLGGIGEGGMVITDVDEYAERLRKFRDHGRLDERYFDEIGYNSHMNAIQAAVLNLKLEELDESNAERIENARFYNRQFSELNAVLPEAPDNNAHVFNTYTIQVAQRDAMEIYLKEKKIGCGIYYPVPLHLQPCFDYLGYKEGDFPKAEQLAKRVISLPVFPGLKRQEINYVAQTVKEFLNG